jgi:hypothetical protein
MDEEYYEKQLFETDDGELYFVNDMGDIFLLTFPDNEESKLEKHENDLEEIKELSNDYKTLTVGISNLKENMKKFADEHGIEIRKKTRKEIVKDYRKRKKSKHLTEDYKRSSMKLPDYEDMRLDFQEKEKKELKYGTKPDYALEV